MSTYSKHRRPKSIETLTEVERKLLEDAANAELIEINNRQWRAVAEESQRRIMARVNTSNVYIPSTKGV